MSWNPMLLGVVVGLASGLALGIWVRGHFRVTLSRVVTSGSPEAAVELLRAPTNPRRETAKTTVYRPAAISSYGRHETAKTAVYNLGDLLALTTEEESR